MKGFLGGWIFFVLIFPAVLPAQQTRGAPTITRLDPGDVVFRQYLADVEAARRMLFDQRRLEPARTEAQARAWATALAETLTIYSYTPAADEDLLSLAARCSIPYSSIATLNRFSSASDMEIGGPLLLPSIPGLYIDEAGDSDLEQLLLSTRVNQGITLTIRGNPSGNPPGNTSRTPQGNPAGEARRFIPGEDFSPTERTFFLYRGFGFPLRNYRVTSSFGPRINPVTGNLRLHQGLDLAAPLGTAVYATREGIVTETGEDPIYGKYLVIQHGDNWVSLYGHLSEINVDLHNSVRSVTVIGKVGSTGQSTGPHLHFELRRHGRAQDPGRYLFKEGSRP